MKSYLQIFTLTIVSLSISGFLSAQQINMQNGLFEQCEGGFLDSGGGGTSYQNGENFTLTICPDVEGDVIGVDFLTFNLNPTNTAPGNNNNQDFLVVYDGNSTAAPSMGTFTENDLQGTFVSASPLNTTGCLTFRFVSNDVGVGDWAGTITCETPCDRPTAVGSDDAPSNRKICIGEVVNFDGTASYAADGFSIDSYLWDFGDGTTTDTPTAAHAWEEPGEYIVELYLVDDNDCASTNQISLQIFVETFPDWEPFPGNETICVGQTIEWDVDPSEFEVTWIGAEPTQSVIVDDGLEDIVGECFDFPLVINGFSPGQTLPDVYSLFSINMDIYHTFLFDLLITITCPSGESVTLHQQMQQPDGPDVGANGTNFGMPNNNECWTYQWTPEATETISQVATTGNNDPLPADEYMSLEALDGLVGCDLNGTWTLSICDLWGGDDGYLCEWGLTIDPSLIPDVTEFTPSIGNESDSSLWSGPNIGEISPDGNSITITPTEPGDFQFTYSVTNDHGCQHDSTVTVTVVPGPEADAGEDLVICEDSLQMAGGIAGEPPVPSECDYTLEMFDSFGDGWNGFNINILEDGVVIGNYTFNTGSEATATIPVTNGATIQIDVPNGGTFPGEVSYSLLNAAGEEVFSDGEGFGNPQVGGNVWSGIVDCSGVGPSIVYEWSPTEGLSNPNISNPMVMVNQNTTYTLTIWEAGTPECNTSDEVEVTIPPEADPGQDNEFTLCYNEPEFAMIDSLLGDPTDTGEWTDENGNVVSNTFNPADYSDGGDFTFTYTVTFGPCVKSAELSITVLEAGNSNCCQTLADAGSDAIACDLDWQLAAEDPIGTGTWSGPPEVTFANPNDPNTTVTADAPGGVIELYWTDNNGFLCAETDTVEIVFMVPVALDLNIIPTTCPDSCSGEVIAEPIGGLGEFTYGWLEGQPGATDAMRTELCDGDVKIYFEDEYGCSDSTIAQMTESPRPLIDDINTTDVTCYGWCDGIIEVIAPDAASYSFDDGTTFQNAALLDSLCPGTYDIEIRNGLNCPNYGVAVIDEPIEVEAEFSMNPSPANWTNTTIQFNSLSYPEPFATYSWTFDTLNVLGTASEKRPTFTFPDTEAGEYPVTLCVENEAGCSDCITYDLIIRETLSVYVPNSFTPNGDGINDLFKAYLSTEHYSDFRMRVFNRQGELVFETTDVEQGWNGGYPDSDYFVLNEVFVYEIQVTDDVVNETLEYTGHVTPVR